MCRYIFKVILVIWPHTLNEKSFLIIDIRGGERRVGGEGVTVEDLSVCEQNALGLQHSSST